ncbi:MAG: hypothetical protein IJ354_09465 [Clostridia bacterium]|nr:hypothetical protein [Clostridia bacterium]
MLEAYWKQPQTHHIGTQEPVAYLIPNVHANEEREASPRLQLLSGTWQFEYYESIEDVDWNAVAAQTRFSHTIQVPGHWQTQGYDQAQYITSPYPFLFDPPNVPPQNPVGVYMTCFQAPEAEKVTLHFDGVDSCGVYFLNGVLLGYSEGPHNPAVFDVTPNLLPGENRLTVAVLKWCSGSYLDDQDKLRLSGIFRDVYLVSRPRTHMHDLFIQPDLTGMDVSLDIAHPSGEVRLKVMDADGSCVCQTRQRCEEHMKLRLDVPAPILWNAETPYLYTLRIDLPDEWVEQRVGLRTVAVEDGKLLLNGQSIKLLGVNRHECDPDTGYVMSAAAMRRDLELMKQFNINCVRTSHYPNDPRFYTLCDEIGLYVIDEADMETHGCFYIGNSDLLVSDARYADAIMDRERQLVERDKNFSSILMWSMGNESGWGCNLAKAAGWIRQCDASRLIHMESAFSSQRRKPLAQCVSDAGPELVDLIGSMYPACETLQEVLELPGENRPVILTEYCHAMGNSLGDIAEYTEAFFRHDRLIGGCIWEWCDHGLRGRDGTMLYGGDFGERKHNGNLCADGLVSPDREPHSALYELKQAYAPVHITWEDGQLRLDNRYDFTDLEGHTIHLSVMHNGSTVHDCMLTCPPAPPHQSSSVDVVLPSLSTEGDNILLAEVMNPRGLSVSRMYFPLAAAAFVPQNGVHPLQWQYRHGMVSQLMAFDQLAVSAVEPVIWRAPLDNDRLIRKTWTSSDAGENIHIPACVINSEATENGLHTGFALGGMSYRAAVTGYIDWDAPDVHTLRVKVDAKVRADYPAWLPRFGLQWTVDKRLKNVQYYGFGPHESYEDKHLSCHPGLWSYDALQRPIPYVRPQEWGGAWNAYFVTMTDDSGKGLIFYSSRPFFFNVQPWTPEEMTAAAHPGDLPPVQALTLNIDLRMSGIGSASVGPELPPHRRIQPGEELSHEWYVAAFDRTKDDAFARLGC